MYIYMQLRAETEKVKGDGRGEKKNLNRRSGFDKASFVSFNLCLLLNIPLYCHIIDDKPDREK